MHVGLTGMLQSFTPDQFVFYILQMHQMMPARILGGQAITPDPGCANAGLFEITYLCNGIACHGIVTSNIALGYNQCNGAITLAAAQENAWASYRDWLPQVASHVRPAGANTYMASTVAANNLRNSIELGQRYHEVNDYIQRLHQQTTNERWASQDRNNFHFRENLGNVNTYTHPYENRPVELPTTYQYYWINRRGDVVGSDDPGFDPRVGTTEEWSKMDRYRP